MQTYQFETVDYGLKYEKKVLFELGLGDVAKNVIMILLLILLDFDFLFDFFFPNL